MYLRLVLRVQPRAGCNAEAQSRKVAKENIPFFATPRLGGLALNFPRQRARRRIGARHLCRFNARSAEGILPKVARPFRLRGALYRRFAAMAAQPWALGRNPVGIRERSATL